MVGKQRLHGAERELAIPIARRQLVVLVPFVAKTEFQGMTSSGQERIVVHLIRIPAVKVGWCAPQTTFHKAHKAAETSSRIMSRDRCEIMIRRGRKNCAHGP